MGDRRFSNQSNHFSPDAKKSKTYAPNLMTNPNSRRSSLGQITEEQRITMDVASQNIHDQDMCRQFLSFVKILFKNRDYIILFIACPLIIQVFYMFPIYLEYTFEAPYYNSTELCNLGFLYYVSGIGGAFIISILIMKEYGSLKCWAISIAITSSLASECAYIMELQYRKYKDDDSD